MNDIFVNSINTKQFMNITFVENKNIDRKKWDFCIDNSQAPLIYGYSWYLDTVVKNWSGLITDDYSCVMPIIWNSKYGIKYIYRPFLVQQLGVFCKKGKQYSVENFINTIPKKFKQITYNFNHTNKTEGTTNTNYILDLNKEYKVLKNNYSKNTKYYVRRANKNKLAFADKIEIEELIKFKQKNLKNSLNKNAFEKIKKLINTLKKDAYIYGVYEKTTLTAVVFFAFFKNTYYYLMAATSQKGRNSGASFFLIDKFIEQHANKDLKIDFEGSNIQGIARFFEGWGADIQIYKTIEINNLPFFAKLLKKLKK